MRLELIISRDCKFHFYDPKSDRIVGCWFGTIFRTYSVNNKETGYEEWWLLDKKITNKTFHI